MHIVVDGECRVLWTAHLAVLTQAVCARSVAELARLCEQLSSVLAVDKDDVVDAALVEEGKLVEHLGELGGGVLCGVLELLDTLAGALREANLTIELCNAEAVHGAGV